MNLISDNPKKLYTLSEFMKMKVVIDPELGGRCRIVMAQRFGVDVILEGFSADPTQGDRDILRAGFFYYLKLRCILQQEPVRPWGVFTNRIHQPVSKPFV
jgi:hypothetical protein